MPTAFLSVYDKAGIVELARGLHELGWTLVSSGGTAKAVEADGVPVTDVAELTGFPAILGHRVVTLHPAVHAGLLADLDQPEHLADLERLGIEPISLAVVNLYPLQQPGDRADRRRRADDGPRHGEEPCPRRRRGRSGAVRAGARRGAPDGAVTSHPPPPGARAFAHTAAYHAAIVTWFDRGPRSAEDQPPSDLPRSIHLALDLVQPLRYGENPHQQGARYRITGRSSWWDAAVQHGGKELSYLNLYDTEAAWRLVHRFDAPTCVIVKHANPCGVASVTGTDDDMAEAYIRANACDPTSAFGGIVACNRPITLRLAEALAPVFTEVVVAPAIDDDALAVLTAKKNLRVLTATAPGAAVLDMRAIDGGLLVQTTDPVSIDRSGWQVVTKSEPDPALYDDLVFAWQVCAAVSSNAIVLAKDQQAFGIGAGQQNRVDSARIAGGRAGERAVGGVCASDAYFPFRDGLDTVAGFGVRAVIEPGGSIRDEEVIAAADEHGIAMVFTGERTSAIRCVGGTRRSAPCRSIGGAGSIGGRAEPLAPTRRGRVHKRTCTNLLPRFCTCAVKNAAQARMVLVGGTASERRPSHRVREAPVGGPGGELVAVGELELAQHGRDVALDGLHREVQAARRPPCRCSRGRCSAAPPARASSAGPARCRPGPPGRRRRRRGRTRPAAGRRRRHRPRTRPIASSSSSRVTVLVT